jgi:hypothetical protein
MNKKLTWSLALSGLAALGAGAYAYYRRLRTRNAESMPVTWDYTEINIENSMQGADAPGVESAIGPENNELSTEGTL